MTGGRERHAHDGQIDRRSRSCPHRGAGPLVWSGSFGRCPGSAWGRIALRLESTVPQCATGALLRIGTESVHAIWTIRRAVVDGGSPCGGGCSPDCRVATAAGHIDTHRRDGRPGWAKDHDFLRLLDAIGTGRISHLVVVLIRTPSTEDVSRTSRRPSISRPAPTPAPCRRCVRLRSRRMTASDPDPRVAV